MPDINIINSISEANKTIRSELGDVEAQTILSNCPLCFSIWPTLIPTLTTSNVVCVYGNNTYFYGGSCCLWTVPVGATRVRFELWGAGAGTGPGMCCAGSPFGQTGAYGSVILSNIPVGCQYTLCAGCAHTTQIYCTCSIDVSGCQSFVSGFGLTNLCAVGGCSNLFRFMCTVHGSSCCRYQARGNTVSGGCLCCDGVNQLFFCFSNSCQLGCSVCPCITRLYDTGRGVCGSTSCGTIYSICSMYPADYFDTNFYGCMCDQPTMLPAANGANTVSSLCCVAYSSGTCCGAAFGGACTGNRCQPGKGGNYNHAMGGSTGLYGDWGRTGMVRVTWC